MSTVPTGPGTCLVCATPINSIHFGIDACRACSSFFKRARVSGKRYPCRQGGGGKCVITRGDNFVCRRCRYDKCVAVGMVYDGLMRPAKRIKETTRPEESIITIIPSPSNQSILGRIAREYKLYIDRRRVKERIVISTAGIRERMPHPTEEIYSTSLDCAKPTIAISVIETWQLFKNAFPSLMELTFADQKELFRSFLPKLHMLEGFYRTIRTFGRFDQFMMCSVIMSVDLSVPDNWLPLSEGGDNRRSLMESMRLFINEQMAVVLPSLERAKISETEMHALLALILCDSEFKTASIERLVDSIRSEALKDLRRYYKEEIGLSNYSMRLGNLMTICHALREGAWIFQESFRMHVAIFDLFTTESLIQEYFL